MKRANRMIAHYEGKNRGPLLIAFGGMHGNEPAGVLAIETMQQMLEVEPSTNPNFEFYGKFIGLIGNLKAFNSNQRFIQRDLNRIWTSENAALVQRKEADQLAPEQQEMKEILAIIHREITDYKPEQIIVLDLHTTSSFGGIFSIVSNDPRSTQIGIELHAPVIQKLIDGISGTTLHFFNEENLGVPTIAVTFESGQHQEDLSVNRAIAALTNCMRTIGCVKGEHVENRHDALLIEYSRDLPKVSDLILCHAILEEDGFEMKPNYRNFQKVKKGEILATDKSGNIRAIDDARILMPLYQKQGEDGFFLIQEIDGF